MGLSLLVDGLASNLISKDSTEGKLESMYFNISFSLDISFLASCVRRRH
jgi:hypothetical protein